MCGKSLSRHILQSSHLDAFSLINQKRYLFLCQFLLDLYYPFVCKHFFRESFKQLSIMNAFILGKGFKVILIRHVKKLKLSQYVNKTFLSSFCKPHLFSLYSCHRWVNFISLNICRAHLNSGIHCSFYSWSGREKGFSCWFVFLLLGLDHLNSEHQSSLGTIFNWNIVVVVDKVLSLGFLGIILLT